MDASSLNNQRMQALLEGPSSLVSDTVNGQKLVCLYAEEMEEKRKAMANEIVAKLTDVCWDKCVTGSIGSSFSHSETSCLSNCAKRFVELKMLTMQRFSSNN